jgi:hypothetical protein
MVVDETLWCWLVRRRTNVKCYDILDTRTASAMITPIYNKVSTMIVIKDCCATYKEGPNPGHYAVKIAPPGCFLKSFVVDRTDIAGELLLEIRLALCFYKVRIEG